MCVAFRLSLTRSALAGAALIVATRPVALLPQTPPEATGPAAVLPAPPQARRSDHVDVYHGETVADPYRWMEEMRSEEVLTWARGQDARARSYAASVPGRDAIRKRMARIADVERFGTPLKGGGRYFYLRTPATGAGPGTALLVRQGLDGEPRVLIDGDAPDIAEGSALARAVPSPDGSRVAYATASVGSRWETWRIRDVATGRDLPETLGGLNGARSALTWSPDGRGFYYDRFVVPEEGAEQSARIGGERVFFHRAGTPQEEDEAVFQQPGAEDLALTHGLTSDGRRLVIAARPASRVGNRVYVLDRDQPEGRPLELVGDAGAVTTFVGGRGSILWFQTDRDAPRGRVVAVDLEDPARPAWRELVPEAQEAIDSWVGVSAIGERLVVGYLRDARLAVRVFDLEGRFQYDMKLPWLGSVWTGFVGRLDDPEAFYGLSGLVDPGSVYRLDVRTGSSTPFLRLDLGHDPEDYVTEQVFFTAADGTRIPMFLARRKDMPRDGPAPVWMYGYGSFGWAAAPWFQPHMVLWLDLGGVWALPNIRGGGEYGESWHEAGSLLRKAVAVEDYLAAANWLAENGYASRERLVANGSSAGGPVVGAALLRRPDLFGAAILDFPALDMLRYEQFTGAVGWRSEYGSVEDPEAFRVLRSTSPVHNVREGVCYPPTLVAPGERDETTPPFHAYKFVAALQRAQGCQQAALLRVSWGAGHTYGSTPEESIENWSDQLAFLASVLDLEVDRSDQAPGVTAVAGAAEPAPAGGEER